MEQFINNIFSAFGFVTAKTDDTTMFFTRKDGDRAEYYIVLNVEKSDFSGDVEKTFEQVNILFDAKKRDAKDIEKNTSLIIFVEFDTYIDDCPRYKNRLLQIEEDEFAYRKYVIPYTQNALSNFKDQEDIVDAINKTIGNENSFDSFNGQMFGDESYFFAMQLFIKLPFLNLSVTRSENFVTIATMLSEKIASNEQTFLKRLLDKPQLEQNERDQLLQKALDPNDESFDSFINSFSGDAPST